MIVMLGTVIILCISHSVYSETYNESLVTQDDLVDCIFSINPTSSIIRRNEIYIPVPIFSKHYIQNIGKVVVTITARTYTCHVLPMRTKKLSLTVFTQEKIFFSVRSMSKAILYISECGNDSRQNIEEIQKDFDKINVLKKTFTLGVTQIPKEHLTLKTLISYFWPENKTNVWQQLFEMVKDSLNQFNATYKFISEDIEDIKKDMVALTENNVTDFAKNYMDLVKKMNYFRIVIDAVPQMDKLYVLPIYSNAARMAIYFLGAGIENPKMYKHQSILRENVKEQYSWVCYTIKYIKKYSIRSIYDTVYAAGLFNVLMNAYNYIAFHGLKQLPIWEDITSYYRQKNIDYCRIACRDPISYSNLYGKATANLLQQAIHINKSPLSANCKENYYEAAKLNSIVIYIRTKKIVYGLTLKFSRNFNTTMGCTETSIIIKKHEFNFENNPIINLKVYRIKFIRCLEFTLSNGTNRVFGNNCGNVYKEFQLKDHCINSLYLANDYPKTKRYFDNIAVSFLPCTL